MFRRGPVVNSDFQSNIEILIAKQIKKGKLDQTLNHYVSNYFPQWSKEEQGYLLVRQGNSTSVIPRDGFFAEYETNEKKALKGTIDVALAAGLKQALSTTDWATPTACCLGL